MSRDSKKVRYQIYSRFNINEPFIKRKFKTYNDAWDYILGELTTKLNLNEANYQEYYVKEITK